MKYAGLEFEVWLRFGVRLKIKIGKNVGPI